MIHKIEIRKNETADTRTCDFANVSKDQLRHASGDHINDVRHGLYFFRIMLRQAGEVHDSDKLTAFDHFHSDFVNGFKTTGWFDNHRKSTRHHLQYADGIPTDVNLIDVLEMIVDGVMGGMARSGSTPPMIISQDLLERAFGNTIELLKKQVVVKDKPSSLK